MGNLIIKKVTYSGDNFYYESPVLNKGINIIIGDNGSGKSTFTYFIEYCLGGNIKYFDPEIKNKKYREIAKDTNNSIELELLINEELYFFKRFINRNDIFIKHNDKYFSYPVYRNNDNKIFSDWLLDKLDISISELNLGTYTWKINISDLLRLIIYDQDTESKKIYKSPNNPNFITDSLIIRKTIFEILLGISSDAFFKKHDEYKEISKKRDLALSKLNSFNEKYNGIDLDINNIQSTLTETNDTLDKLYNERNLYLSTNTKVNEKAEFINKTQQELIDTDINISNLNIDLKAYTIEYEKISRLYENQLNEIHEIEKIIFTNDKLNLFSFKICPFCMSEHNPKENFCLCGQEIKDEDYEKFVYNSNEYKNILTHKKKSLETIQTALDSYSNDIKNYQKKIDSHTKKSSDLTEKLKQLISAIEFSGNSELIDDLNDKILEAKREIDKFSYLKSISLDKKEIDDEFDIIHSQYKTVKKEYEGLLIKFELENKSLISEFNIIYEALLKLSSAKISTAEIDEDYMPIIDGGIYKNKSADVPIRLMYFYTILTLSLKYKNVKHPKLLIIDTPEDSGIDEGNLKNDLELLVEALKLIDVNEKTYQVILTTGLNKYPEVFKDFIIERFNTLKNNFILKPNPAQ